MFFLQFFEYIELQDDHLDTSSDGKRQWLKRTQGEARSDGEGYVPSSIILDFIKEEEVAVLAIKVHTA